jgi:hypothetical protein
MTSHRPLAPQRNEDLFDEQVRMFGIYVQSISVSAGLGGNGGTMQLKLIEDEANGVVLPKDIDGNPFYGATTGQPMIDNHAPSTGTACYFKMGNFYFGGIFQRWSYSESPSGGRVYDIVLESPSKLMDGVQLIIDQFNGATDVFANQYDKDFFEENQYSTNRFFRNRNRNPGGGREIFNIDYNLIHNVFNPFAYWENPDYGVTGLTDPDPLFGKYINFGKSGFNTSGVPINKLIAAMDKLMKLDAGKSDSDTVKFFGGPITFGVSENPFNPISMHYSFNMSRLIEFLAEEGLMEVSTDGVINTDILNRVRVKGPSKSCNGFFGELAELFQFDYFYTVQHREFDIDNQPVPVYGYYRKLLNKEAVEAGLEEPKYEEGWEGYPSISLLPNGGGKITDQSEIIKLADENGEGGQVSDEFLGKAEIAIKIVSKRQSPERNRIRSFINEELLKEPKDRIMTSYTIGKEFGDTVTQKIVWGGRRTRYLKIGNYPTFTYNKYALDIGDVADQYVIWGKNDNPIRKDYNIVGSVRDVYSNPLQPRTVFLENVGQYEVCPFELRMAMAGKEAWSVFKIFQTLAGAEPNGYNMFNAPWQVGFDPLANILGLLASGTRGNSYDLVLSNLQRSNQSWQTAATALADQIFSGIANIANSSFGQEFFLMLPNEIPGPFYNLYNAIEDFQILKSWEMSDSAFDPSPLTYDIDAWDAVGRVNSLVSFELRQDCDYSGLGTDYNLGANLAGPNFLYPFGSIVSKKGSPDKETYFDATGFFGGAFLVAFKTGCQVKLFDAVTTPDFGLTVLANMFFGIEIPPIRYIGSGKESMQFPVPPDLLLPNMFGVPQQSGRLNYGPWITYDSVLREDAEDRYLNPDNPNLGFRNPNGKAEVVEDESLRPETFGSHELLQTIGSVVANVSNTNLYESESGSIDLAGYPEWNIGERFDSLGPYVTNMSITVDATGGAKTSYKFNTWTPQFGKMSKYNIDRIQKINKNAFNFLKKKRDEVEQRPFPKIKFEKGDFKELNKAQQAHTNNNALQMLFSARPVAGNY